MWAAVSSRQKRTGARFGNARAFHQQIAQFAAIDAEAPGAVSDLALLVRARLQGAIFLQADSVRAPTGTYVAES